MKFTKMQGCGNDYIYFNCFEQNIDDPEGLSIKLSDRHFGIGGDGIVMILPSDVADAKMRMFNADGSEGKMCGNAIRCVAKYLYDNKMVNKEEMKIETLSGIKALSLTIENSKMKSACVAMGKAELNPKNIPVLIDKDRAINEEVVIDGIKRNITCVSMGNPHCVIFIDGIDEIDIEKEGRPIEIAPIFPERVNTEFVEVIDKNTVRMRVWERGSGETLACGTGACAAVVACCENGFCNKGEDVLVKLRGGELIIKYTDDMVYMSGIAETVFNGEI